MQAGGLAADALNFPALFGKLYHELIAFVTLNLDDAILAGSPAAETLLELFSVGDERIPFERNAGHNRHAATLAPLRLTSYSDDAIVWEIPSRLDGHRGSLPRVIANLLARRLLLLAAPLGRIDDFAHDLSVHAAESGSNGVPALH